MGLMVTLGFLALAVIALLRTALVAGAISVEAPVAPILPLILTAVAAADHRTWEAPPMLQTPRQHQTGVMRTTTAASLLYTNAAPTWRIPKLDERRNADRSVPGHVPRDPSRFARIRYLGMWNIIDRSFWVVLAAAAIVAAPSNAATTNPLAKWFGSQTCPALDGLSSKRRRRR